MTVRFRTRAEAYHWAFKLGQEGFEPFVRFERGRWVVSWTW